MQTGGTSSVPGRRRIRRRDRHGRGLRPAGAHRRSAVPAARRSGSHLVLDAVARLEPRWEAELSGIEFAVQEVPDEEILGEEIVPVPLARIDPGEADPLRMRPAHGRRGSCSTGGRCWPGRKTRMN